ncbi:L-threonate dehydrogenase [Rubellimicrobium roseum]|uniref:L-threonate dehydrogenase n=1 Tax=Rubellimicrobium roseum TaxID=687525 RepID=A0A5C4N7D4_9RHOB|nr:L-threonate dehydrogenase [Rubellimicrobium roseum]TNC63093.1 NAD(P)-dependent oxidoreductase [Rubellimicrobium roseum]
MTQDLKVGVFGLGSMGSGIAASLLRAGLDTAGFDVAEEAVARFAAVGGRTGTLEALAPSLSVAVIVVVNAAQTEDLLFGASALAGLLPRSAVVLGCATVPPETARTFEARLAERGLLYLDAPISGGSAKAAEGALTLMASGAPAAFEAAQPVLSAMAAKIFTLGDAAGAGSAMKAVNQMLAGIHIAAAAEAMTFGLTQGVAPDRCLEVITQCAGTSWMFENRGAHIAAGDYTARSAVDIFVKDLGIVSDIARVARFAAPLTATALQQFLAAAGMGLGREDDAAVAKVYARNAGLRLPGET